MVVWGGQRRRGRRGTGEGRDEWWGKTKTRQSSPGEVVKRGDERGDRRDRDVTRSRLGWEAGARGGYTVVYTVSTQTHGEAWVASRSLGKKNVTLQ